MAASLLLLAGWGAQASSPRHLVFIEVHKDGVSGTDGLRGAWSALVSPDGRHVYVAGYMEDALAVFRRDAATGRLTFVEVQRDRVAGVRGMGSPCHLAGSPDGRFVYVAAHWDHAIAVFRRESTTGRLRFVEAQTDGIAGVEGLRAVQGLAVSPDGGHVYAAAWRDHAVSVFRRDGATGRLTFVEAQRDETRGVRGLAGASAVAVSPDGTHAYVTAYFDAAITVFRRDRMSGRLVLVDTRQDGVGGVNGPKGAFALAFGPGGRHLYVAGKGDHALAVFSRDAATGRLTFLEAEVDDTRGVDGLQGVSSVAVTPDGRLVLTTGWAEHALTVFHRDRTSGRVVFAETQWDGHAGVDGLQGASSVNVSPDGRHAYVTGNWEQALAVFGVVKP